MDNINIKINKMKDGIYKSENAKYFIKDGKIIMSMSNGTYKTNKNFMQGTYKEPLKESMVKEFDSAYNKLKHW